MIGLALLPAHAHADGYVSAAMEKIKGAVHEGTAAIALESLSAQRAWVIWRGYKATGDKKKLEQLRSLAAEKDSGALNVVGYLYSEGVDGVKKDSKRAVELFRQAADAKLPLAAYNLGLLMMKGEGVAVDTRGAMTHFATAAPDIPQAAVRVALLNVEIGRYQDSWAFAQMAAKKGDPWGHYLCGKLLMMGVGSGGLRKAREHLALAVDGWHPDAAPLLADIIDRQAADDSSGLSHIHAGSYRIVGQAMRQANPAAAVGLARPDGLSNEEYERAMSEATTWIGNHPKPQKPLHYNRPIPTPDA